MIDPAAELQLRELAPRVLGAVARRCGDFALAEDAVQDALLAAVEDWPARGVPQNPGGWLFAVALRRFRDRLDAEKARSRREALAAAAEVQPAATAELEEWSGEDDTLALLFTCCHPALTGPSAIALTLRAVSGLTTAAIAHAFLAPEATMAQRISRAKQTIQESGVPLAVPPPAERRARLDAVLHVLYLMFNEGHTSSAGDALMRPDLSREAIRLARLLLQLVPDHAEAQGLLALLLLTEARRQARAGPHGELIPLQEQDRTRWDRTLIAEGSALVTAALARGAAGPYQVQAAIAALHGEASTFAATDWAQILVLFGLLQKMTDNPVVALNRAVALAMVRGPAEALAEVDRLETCGRLQEQHRLEAVRAHLHEMAGDRARAVRHFRAAAERTANIAERNYLLTKATRLADGLESS